MTNPKGKPFVYRGAINVEDCTTVKEVIEKAHLDWTVRKCELVAKMPMTLNNVPNQDNNNQDSFLHAGSHYREVPNAYATYRSDINYPLGIVKDRYEPVQNVEAFDFFDGAIGENKAKWQTAGCFGMGERIFVSAKLPNDILVNGDHVENYLVFTTSHDGSTGVKILFTPIRVICENTLNAAIKGADNYVSFRHTQSVHNNIDIAADILGISKQMSIETQMAYNEMANIKVNDENAQKYFAKLILTNDELQRLNDTGYSPFHLITRNYNAMYDANISTKKTNTIAEMYNYYQTGIGQKEILGTAWGVYNAVTGYYSNVDKAEGTKRMDSLLYGDKSRKIMTAGNMALSLKSA